VYAHFGHILNGFIFSSSLPVPTGTIKSISLKMWFVNLEFLVGSVGYILDFLFSLSPRKIKNKPAMKSKTGSTPPKQIVFTK